MQGVYTGKSWGGGIVWLTFVLHRLISCYKGWGDRKPGLFCAEAPAPAVGAPAQQSGRAARQPESDRALRRRARPRAARASSPRVGEPWNPQRGGRGARLGPEPRRGRRLPRGALKTSLASEDKPPHLHQPGGRAPAGRSSLHPTASASLVSDEDRLSW